MMKEAANRLTCFAAIAVLAGIGPALAQTPAPRRKVLTPEQVKFQADTARLLRHCNLMILPSLWEGCPVSIMEAMALGRPVISTYIAGIPELVQPGKNGWLVPSGDDVALAEAMREALAAPLEQLAVMAAAGRALIIEHYDVLKEAKKLKKLFDATT